MIFFVTIVGIVQTKMNVAFRTNYLSLSITLFQFASQSILRIFRMFETIVTNDLVCTIHSRLIRSTAFCANLIQRNASSSFGSLLVHKLFREFHPKSQEVHYLLLRDIRIHAGLCQQHKFVFVPEFETTEMSKNSCRRTICDRFGQYD